MNKPNFMNKLEYVYKIKIVTDNDWNIPELGYFKNIIQFDSNLNSS